MPPTSPRPALLAATAFLLFSVWAGSFIAIEALLAGRFDWLSLTVARFVPVAILCGSWCLLRRRAETLAVVRTHWRRLLLCGLFMVPGYNFALYYGQEHRIAAPIASLLTALAPLFLLILSALFLSERITARRAAGFAIAAAGVVLVARARTDTEGTTYPLLVALTAIAPLCWALQTAIAKPVMRRVSPLVWTYLSICFGTAPLFLVLPFRGGLELLRLDPAGHAMLGYLSVLCTILGFALWTWLLRHLTAGTVGFTIFLNPPLTTVYKLSLAALFPAAFAFSVRTGEVLGGLVVLAGVGVAVLAPARAAR
ncbi:MAG: DMT family transporter [Planctomycetes bacterium]|jgi:drug/metabolite transporter (DMT)-like permease|nr:DMT family transporter [Planctomycetota bacterium]